MNYPRMTPVYLTQMYELKDKDGNIWALLDAGGFSMDKSGIPFIAIASDHSIEQENRDWKLLVESRV